MFKTASPPVQGSIIVGQMEILPTTHLSRTSRRQSLLIRLQTLVMRLLGLSSLVLVANALCHHQFAIIPWALLAIVPTPVLATITTIYEKKTRPDPDVVAMVDWLRHLPSISLFADLEKGRLGCLTNDGLYTITKSHYPWRRLKISSVTTNVPVPSGGIEHRVILRVFEDNFTKRCVLLAYLGLLSIIILIAFNVLAHLLEKHGLRADVLALALVTLFDMFALAIFSGVLAKLNREYKQGWEMPFIINARHIRIEDLLTFVERHQ